MRGQYWFIFLMYGFFSCIPHGKEIPDDPRTFDPSNTDLLELSSALPYFKDFIKASDQTNITNLLEDEGPYTIFMPNQLAFSRFRSENGIRSTDQVPEETLKQILLYHIIRGRWLLLIIPIDYYPTLALEKTTGNPIDLFIDTGDLLRLNGVVSLDEPDLESTNGVIHSINTVLNIPTIMTHLSVNREFSMIYAILNRNDIQGEFSDLLSDEVGPYTFLAPDNDAILSFLGENPEWKTMDEIPSGTLIEIIKYHLVPDVNILVKNIEKTATVIPSNGGILTIQSAYPDWYVLDGQNRKARIILHDIQGINGIIHQIDRVLTP